MKHSGPKIKSIQEFIGKKFGYWTLIEDFGRIDRKRLVKVKCVCDFERNIDFAEIKRGKSTSCGCQVRSDINDYIGKKVNRLTVLEAVGVLKGKTRIKVKCDCGNELICRFDCVVNETTKSCGCWAIEAVTTHGLSGHPLFTVWTGMRQRCSDENSDSYKDYGGIGVVVCDEWKDDFYAFYSWAIDKWEPGLQIDKDILSDTKPGKIYSTTTCLFVTRKDNMRATRNNVVLEYKGESMCVSEWCEKLNMDYRLVLNRVRLGWGTEKAFLTPLDKRYSNIYRKCK